MKVDELHVLKEQCASHCGGVFCLFSVFGFLRKMHDKDPKFFA